MLDQFIDEHHVLKIRVRQVGKKKEEKDFEDPGMYTAFLGKSISLTISPSDETTSSGSAGASKLEFIGIVTEVRILNSIHSINNVLLTCHSPTVTMDGAELNTFQNDKKVSDIIGSIVSGYPITPGKIESTDRNLRFSVQYRETDYRYILRLASLSGKFALYDGKEFRVTSSSSSDPAVVNWRKDLGLFTTGFGTAPMEYTADVYNYEQKKTYSQDSKSVSQNSSLSESSKKAPDASGKIYERASYADIEPVEDARSLDETLDLKRSQAKGKMVLCKGESTSPEVLVGRCVKIVGMDKLDGLYWVNWVQHVFDESGKYHNEFRCTPLDLAYPAPASERERLTQLQPAVVVDNNDPDKLGRVKVSFPWSGSEQTPWARFVTFHAGKDWGAFCLPEVGDEVLTGFEFGNPDLPVVLGSLYNKENKPLSKTGSEENLVKCLTTKSGNEIFFNDKSGSEELIITMKGGKNQIVMALSGPSISIKSDGDVTVEGKNISVKADEKVSIESGKDLEVKAGGNLTLEASGNLKSKATGNLDAEGMMVNVKGTPINLN